MIFKIFLLIIFLFFNDFILLMILNLNIKYFKNNLIFYLILIKLNDSNYFS